MVKIQEFFMVFQIQIYIEFFCYSMWPVKSQDYKLSYVRSKNIDFGCISFLRDDEIRQNVIVPNKANLHFWKSSKIRKNFKNYKNLVIFLVWKRKFFDRHNDN